ncbi:hypothetical protein ATKI12_6109 [Kitasatospora sp. Ki12]
MSAGCCRRWFRVRAGPVRAVRPSVCQGWEPEGEDDPRPG